LFQSACEASAQESTAVLLPPAAWKHGSGWLLVYALRWLGTARRLQAPDLLCGALCPPDGVPLSVPNADLAQLVREGVPAEAGSMAGPSMDTVLAARKLAQERLRELIGRREGSARSTAGLSLLMVIAVGT
jgi:hypothetical protein